MIIAVPANTQYTDSQIAHRFSRARYFLFYNSQTNTCCHVENPPAVWGGGVYAADAMVEYKADVVIAEQIGGHVLERLRSSGIQVVHGKTGVVLDLITEYLGK